MWEYAPEKKLISDKAKLNIGQITNLSKSNKNSYVKSLLFVNFFNRFVIYICGLYTI